MVAAGHPEVTAAAAEVLGAGGNAFDATVAAGFAAATAEPGLTSLGGGGFLLARTSTGQETLFDFFVETPGLGSSVPVRGAARPHFVPVTLQFPGSTQTFNVGLGSVAVPGALAGYLHVHRRLGRLPLAGVVAPAVRLAAEGVILNQSQAYVIDLLLPILTLTEGGAAIYQPDGRRWAAGDRFANPDLAGFLARLGDGSAEGFGHELAARVAAEMAVGGGLLTEADLGSYAVVERDPLAVEYRGRRLLTNPPPSFGGSLVALALVLQGDRPVTVGGWGSAEHVVGLVEVMREVDRIRAAGQTDQRLRSSGGTTHVSVSDGEGNVAAMTTSNGEGSGYVVPGTGVMLNNMLGEDDLHPEGFHLAPPGERVASMMAPTMVLEGGGVRLALGSGGSKRIRTALLQVIVAVVDLEVPVADAVPAPRLHWDGEVLQVEPGFPREAVAALAERWPVNEWSERNLYFGGVQAVEPGRGGAGDPRRGGHALAV